MQNKPKLFLVVNVDWFFVSHRLPIALEALKRGYDVTIFSIDTGRADEIRSHGLRFIPLPTSRAGMNILQEIKVLMLLFRYYRNEKPDIVHHVAVKPVTYGSLVAKILGVPKVVNALSGLGFLFINADKNRLVHSIVNRVFKFGFKNKNLTFILQNHDDFAMIKNIGVLEDHQIKLIKGSGVDLTSFHFTEEKPTQTLKVILPARMLYDKGVVEFVEVAHILKPKYKETVDFVLVGNVDMENNAGIEESQLLAWHKEGAVSWIDYQKDIIPTLIESHIVVLPSYREGLPKSLIEACAIGRAIVTTDVPGCREVVKEGENGFLVENKNVPALAAAIEKLILDKPMRLRMGLASRKKAEEEFSLKSVIDKTFAIYEQK
jgi:glycosyltransferase involved in cell wall biosynthesis